MVLRDSLATNNTITDLYFRNFNMTNSDIEILVQGMLLNKMKNIRSLSLEHICLQSQGIKALTSYLSQIDPPNFQELKLSFIENLDSDDLGKMFKANTNLKTFKLENCQFKENKSDLIFAGLAKHPGLEHLSLASINVSSEGFKNFPIIVRDTNIKKLELDFIVIQSAQDVTMQRLKEAFLESQTL